MQINFSTPNLKRPTRKQSAKQDTTNFGAKIDINKATKGVNTFSIQMLGGKFENTKENQDLVTKFINIKEKEGSQESYLDIDRIEEAVELSWGKEMMKKLFGKVNYPFGR